MKQRSMSRSIRLHFAEDDNIANRRDWNRSTPRADAQRLAIRYNCANRRDPIATAEQIELTSPSSPGRLSHPAEC